MRGITVSAGLLCPQRALVEGVRMGIVGGWSCRSARRGASVIGVALVGAGRLAMTSGRAGGDGGLWISDVLDHSSRWKASASDHAAALAVAFAQWHWWSRKPAGPSKRQPCWRIRRGEASVPGPMGNAESGPRRQRRRRIDCYPSRAARDRSHGTRSRLSKCHHPPASFQCETDRPCPGECPSISWMCSRRDR
jgi:hypothetical protein